MLNDLGHFFPKSYTDDQKKKNHLVEKVQWHGAMLV